MIWGIAIFDLLLFCQNSNDLGVAIFWFADVFVSFVNFENDMAVAFFDLLLFV